MTVEEEFESLVAPYARVAETMGYRRLERRVGSGMEPQTLWSCIDFYFDGDATFLDLSAQIPRGRVPGKYVTGFCGVQFYTFARIAGEDNCVITNGTPPEQQKPRRTPIAMLPLLPFINWIESHVPEHAQPLAMKGPEDLPLVLERHHTALAARRGVVMRPVTENPLEERWQWSEMFNA